MTVERGASVCHGSAALLADGDMISIGEGSDMQDGVIAQPVPAKRQRELFSEECTRFLENANDYRALMDSSRGADAE